MILKFLQELRYCHNILLVRDPTSLITSFKFLREYSTLQENLLLDRGFQLLVDWMYTR